MNRRITQVALAAAAAMTISLASPVAANAKDSAGATADAPGESAPPGAPPPGDRERTRTNSRQITISSALLSL